ncbi:MAG: leucyl aminopeptidase [Caulobacterales bacterium]
MDVSFPAHAEADAVIIPAGDKGKLASDAAQALDQQSDGLITAAIEASGFRGGVGKSLEILAPRGIDAKRVLVIGVGDTSKTDASGFEAFGAQAVKALLSSGAKSAAFLTEGFGAIGPAEAAARTAFGGVLAAYRFDAYRTKLKADQKPSLAKIQIVSGAGAAAETAFESLSAVAEGVYLARDLVSEPPNVLFPQAFAKRLRELTALGVEVEVLGEKELADHDMRALLGVGQGSVRESQLVTMRWKGAKRKESPTLAVVGKGVCFDSGGISLKPGGGMDEMKGDMGGAAAVAGLMHAIAARKAKANVVGVVGLVENMPDGAAQRPGDIVTAADGQTIEILNTDAEGRLVLCDAMHYAQKQFEPKWMIDLATLTGAIITALGSEHAGVFSNDDGLAEAITAAGNATGEPVWRLPMGSAYDRMIDSKIADMKNIATGRPGAASSIVAAQFLLRFVKKDVLWAHLDIAGTAWKSGSDDPREPTWATGWGVRLLDRLVQDLLEA